MATLSSAERRALRAKAHHLHAVVSIGQHGLTPSVLHEIDVNLMAHELIKIRVFSDARADRDAMLERICGELGAAPVQHLGKLLIVWRAAPKEPAEKAPPRRNADTAKSAARKAPQARRPRTPLPRAPARPPPRGKSTPIELPATPTSRRRRAMTNAASTWEDTDARRQRRPKVTSGPAAPRSGRRPASKGSSKAAPRPAAGPHGKSSSSRVGAAGARRRRRKAG
jgi:putative YhbY family RNA-binding protein